MSVPIPSLTYHWNGMTIASGEGIVGDGPSLYRVFEATAWLDRRAGDVEVWVRGPMLRKDGTPSRAVQRSIRVATTGTQPEWLNEVINDARARLLPDGPSAAPAGPETAAEHIRRDPPMRWFSVTATELTEDTHDDCAVEDIHSPGDWCSGGQGASWMDVLYARPEVIADAIRAAAATCQDGATP